MTTPQIAQSAAYTAFLLLTTEAEATTRKIPIFFKYTETLRDLMSKAQVANAASLQKTNGTTADKAKVKTQLLDDMTLLTDLVLPYADDANETVLSERVKNFSTIFGRTKQAEIATLCRDIVGKVRGHLTALSDYGVTAEMLTNLEHLIDVFDGKVPETLSQSKERGVNTQLRDALFVKMNALMMNKILKTATGFKQSDPDFYSRIVATTTVAETQTPPTVLRIRFVDASGKPAKHTLRASIMGSDAEHTPNEKGDIVMKFAKGGRQDIHIPIEGGAPIVFKGLMLRKGKTKTLRVTL
jgi:hypothetical protein